MRWRQLMPLLGLVVLGYLIYSLDLEKLASIFGQLPWWFLLFGFVLWLKPVLWTAVEWWVILREHGISVSFWVCVKNILLGFFYGLVTPGGVGGYVRTIYLQEESGAPLEKCVANILLLNTVDFLSVLGIAVVGSVMVLGSYPWFLVLTLGLFLVVSVLFVAFVNHDFLGGLLERIMRSRLFSRFSSRLGNDDGSVAREIPTLRKLWLPFVLSVSGWLVLFYMFYLVGLMFGVEVPFWFFVLSVSIGSVVGMLPITIYGLGTRDATLITLFSLYNVSAEAVLAMSLFWFVAVWILPSVLGGIVALHYEGKMGMKKADS